MITETQKQIIESQKQAIADTSTAIAESGEVNLTPDQEAALALYLGEFQAVGATIRSFINDLLHRPG